MEFTWGLIAFIFFVQVAANFVKTIAGFGNGVISGPLLALKLNNSAITPANSMIDLPINAVLAWRERKYFSVKKVLPYALIILAGVIPGAILLKLSPPWILKVVLGGFVILIGIKMLIPEEKLKITKKIPRFVQYIIFVLSGLTSGMFGINMFFVPYFNKISENRHEFRGNICFVYTLDTSLRIILFLILGMITLDVLKVFAVSIAGAAVGMLLGMWTDRFLKEEVVKKIGIWLFVLAGVVIIIRTLITKS